MRKPKTAVFFDIGNVLVAFDARRAAKKISRALGLHPLALARYFWSRRLAESIELGKLKPRAIHRLFRSELGFKGDFQAFQRLWCGHFTLRVDVVSLYRRVARRHPVYLLSNTNSLHFEFIRRRYGFAREARGAALSYRLGLRKPDPRIYEAALRMARSTPEEAVFIDDRGENVAAARKLGIRAIRFTDAPALRRELARLGLL